MRWGDFRRSDNVDDRTGEDPGAGGGGFPLGGGMRLGGGALVVIVVASLIFGVNPLEMIGMLEGGAPPAAPNAGPPPGYGPQRTPGPPPPRAANAAPDPKKDFVSAVLGDTEDSSVSPRMRAENSFAVSCGARWGVAPPPDAGALRWGP